MNANTLNEHLLAQVGMVVVEAAYDIFVDCGAESDFAIQGASDRVAVFGSVNRLIWSISKGFYPDRSYCTKKFLEAWDKRDTE